MELVIAGGLLVALGGGGSGFAFFRCLTAKKKSDRLAEVYRKLQVIPAAPATPRSGRVVFRGHVETDAPVVEPITGESCVWFHSTAFARRWVKRKKGSTSGRWRYRKKVPRQGQAGFSLRDEAGVVVCDGVRLRVDKAPVEEVKDWATDETPESIRSALAKLGVKSRCSFLSWRLGYSRRVIKAGDQVFAYGGVELPSANDPYRSTTGYRLVAAGGLPVTLSTMSPDELRAFHLEIARSNVPLWFALAFGVVFTLVGGGVAAAGLM